MDDSPVILIVIAVCFIIMISISIYNFIRIGNLQNASAESEISIKNESIDNAAEVLSNITKVKSELKVYMLSNIDIVKKQQSNVDMKQDIIITKNKTDILLVQSNIENNIEKKLLDFDGNFKSIQSNIEENTSNIAGNTGRQTTMNDIISDNTSNIAFNTGRQTTMNAIITGHTNDIAGNTGRQTSNTSDIATLNTTQIELDETMETVLANQLITTNLISTYHPST
jgi:hypothetical protein